MIASLCIFKGLMKVDIRGHDTVILLKDLRSQLLVEEVMIENMNAAPMLIALVAQQSDFNSKNSSFSF